MMNGKVVYDLESKIVRNLVNKVSTIAKNAKTIGLKQKSPEKIANIGTEVVEVAKDKFGRKILTTELKRNGNWPLMSEIIMQKNGGCIINGNGFRAVVDKNGKIVREKLPYQDKIFMPNGTVIYRGHGSKLNVCAEIYSKQHPEGIGIRTGAVKNGKTYSVVTDFKTKKHQIFSTDNKGEITKLGEIKGSIPNVESIPVNGIDLNIATPPAPYSADLLRAVMTGKI